MLCGSVYTLTYDAENQLTAMNRANCVTADGSHGSYSQRSYAFDNAGNITNFESTGTNLYYQNGAHKHAVTHVGGTTAGYQKYWYDQNGNATRRISGSQDVTLTYDAENRLTAMSGGVTSSYVYDADGNRVKETIAGVTRVFVGNYYELDNGTVKKYYYAGATRVAENSGGVLYYLLADHLGSTALTLDSSGVRVTELRYYPFGAARYNANNQLTTYRFTGQRWDSGTALYFYQSRWYDPLIGRFLQADTIVPNPQNPQNLNRYSYALNNSVRFSDPSGHYECEGAINCDGDDPPFPPLSPPTYSGPCISVVCLPTPTPTLGMMIPGTPGPQWVAPTATPYAGAWIGPGGPWTPAPTPHPYVPPMERINKPATLWGIGQALYLDIPALVEKYSGTVIRAGGRSLNYAPPGLMTTLGYAASVGPNVVQHLQQGENLTSFELLTDVVVDSGGWALTLGTGPALSVTGASFGSAAPPAGPVIGGVVGYLVGTVGVSLYWDIQIAPAIRPTVRGWFGN